MLPLEKDLSVATFNNDYANVGQNCFNSKLLPGVNLPSPGFMSFKYLNVIDFEVDQVIVQKKSFERILVKIPQAIQETQPSKLEQYVN